MPRRSSSSSSNFGGGGITFGGRVPPAVGLLIAVTVGASLFVAFAGRHGFPADALPLVAERVWHGEVWRLATWFFIETSPLSLLFAALAFYWFGRDLAYVWGGRRFLGAYLGLGLVSGALTAALGWLDGDVMAHTYVGNWALVEGLVVAWGTLYPTRQIYIYFVLPLSGRVLVWLTIGLTVAWAAYSGWQVVLPNLVAMAAVLGYMFRGRLVARLRAMRATSQARRARGERASHLKVVREDQRPPKKWLN